MTKLKNSLACITADVGTTANKEELPYIFVTEFNDASVISFYEKFIQLQANPKVKIIPILISSYGGQLHALFAMLDIMQSATKPVSTIALGKAMSCGAILLAAGTKGYRYAAERADIMLHEVSSMEWGKTADVTSGAKHTQKLNNNVFRMLAKLAGSKDPELFLKRMKERGNTDWYLSSDEYRKLGLIDYTTLPKLTKE